ncbi:MAG: AsmA family protein [Jannaschia helgolandensis]
MKWLIRSALTLVTLILIAVVVLIMVPTERVAQLAADRFEATTGRALTLGGPVKATLWPRPGIRAEGIEIANADWSDQGPMLTAETLEVGIALGSIFGSDIRIETLQIDGARLILERNADGRGNWEISGTPVAQPGSVGSDGGGTSARALSIDRAILTGADVTWLDHGVGTQIRLRAVDLETRLADLNSPVRITGSALVNGQAVTLEASLDAARSLMQGALTPVAFSLRAGETALRLDGRADLDPLSFEGRIEATSSDRFKVANVLGIVVPDLPDGLGARSIALNAAITLAPAGTLHFRDMIMDLDSNRLTGALDVDPNGARTRLVANLSADTLDLTALSRKGQGGETALVSETGWARETLDVSGLFAADGELTFSSGAVTMGDATFDEVRARAVVDDGRAVITLQPLIAYGGTVTGDVVVNGRGGLSSRATLELSGLQMQPFLTEFADFDRLIGQADISLDLLGIGDTTQQLIDSLAGNVAFRMGAGEILGLDIGGMVRTLDLGYRGEGQKTVFDGVSSSFVVTDGIARGNDLSLTAPYLLATGAGDIALGAQTISYRLIPTLRRGGGSDGITVPLLIEGPWSDPRIRPDLEYIARQKLDVERAQTEARDRAGELARTRLADELEIAPEVLTDRDALEDALKDRVEEKLLDFLLGR